MSRVFTGFKPEAVETSIPMIITVGRRTLIEAIRAAGIDLPLDCEISFRVPGGGDYSNMDVDLDDAAQVVSVRYRSK